MDSILPDSPQSKQCKVCSNYYLATSEWFAPHKGCKNGLLPLCKKCLSAQKREKWAKDHPKKVDTSIPEGHKRCSACKEIKPATSEHFWKAADGQYGLESRCKDCRRKYKESRKDIAKEKKHLWYMANRERLLEYCRLNKLHSNALQRERRKANPEKYRAKQRNYWSTRTERQREIARNTYRRNRERFYANVRNRKARKKGNGGTHTAQELQDQLVRQKHKCYYCHRKFEKTNVKGKIKYIYHVEHIVPLSRGGSNAIWNIVLACPECNLSKRDKLLHEWAEGGRLL